MSCSAHQGVHNCRRHRLDRRLEAHQHTGAEQQHGQEQQVFDACLGSLLHPADGTDARRTDGKRRVPDPSQTRHGARGGQTPSRADEYWFDMFPNRPTPRASMLDRRMTTDAHFRRDHFDIPEVRPLSLAVEGAVGEASVYDEAGLARFPVVQERCVLECAGHRRTEFNPPAPGLAWRIGSLGEAVWRGPTLGSILSRSGVSQEACEVVLHGADRGVVDGHGATTFSRSLPIDWSLLDRVILATHMNGEPLRPEHGAPIRVIVPGWYATDAVKWLVRIEAVTEPFRGYYQELDYRLQFREDDGIGARMTEMPIHGLLLSHEDGETVGPGGVELRGIAWGGRGVSQVDVCVDGRWHQAELERGGRYARSYWTLRARLEPGQHELRVRAADEAGTSQPAQLRWNRKGYQNTSQQLVRLRAA
jgi:DMSO/TMAO reductase YedYZ molybdopterin-dependent catalytic subunit